MNDDELNITIPLDIDLDGALIFPDLLIEPAMVFVDIATVECFFSVAKICSIAGGS